MIELFTRHYRPGMVVRIPYLVQIAPIQKDVQVFRKVHPDLDGHL